ncbi:MAG TPA: hypothetical protein VK581_04320 [Chthoniobacterales bacterium]|nr:hypothetical protein [Chthoniobacterales bacterium]
MNTQWRKIPGDFRQHRLQIFLLALVLTLGTAGVVAALNARAILAREIAASFASANSPDIILWSTKSKGRCSTRFVRDRALPPLMLDGPRSPAWPQSPESGSR